MRMRLVLEVCLLVALMSVTQAAEPLGYWPLDGHLNDLAGPADGSFLGGAPAYVKGKMGQAMAFDGVDDYVEVMVNNLDAYTISAWVKPDRTDAASIIARTSASGPLTHWSHQMRITASGVFEHYLWDGSARAVLGTSQVTPGNWYFVVITATNDGAVQLYVNGQEEGNADTVATMWGDGDRFHIGSNSGGSMGWFQGGIDEVRIYNEALAQEEIERVMKASLQASSDPVPADGAADVLRDVVLSWSSGESAETHDVYLGTAFDDVNEASRADSRDVLLGRGQTGATYEPGTLAFGQTYYWRVDEVNAAPDYTIFRGEVWSFTVEPFAYPIVNLSVTSNGISIADAGPENTINGSGLNADDQHSTTSEDMWLARQAEGELLQIEYAFDRAYKLHEMRVWNYNVEFEPLLGFGVKDVTVEYSEDGTEWLALGDVELTQATARADYIANTTVPFGGVAARCVRLTVTTSYGGMGQFGLSEIRFLYVPVQAREPEPAGGAVDIGVNTELRWRSGREADTHDVYLSTDETAVADGTALLDTTDVTVADPGPLDLAATYYWKVNEVNDFEAISSWEGEIWSFATMAYLVVEDFEGYDDEENLIYESWLDGWINSTGSTVGYLQGPFAEQSIVHSGGQSMPMFFDNVGGLTTSEAERTLDVPMDWTAHGIESLSLYFQGAADNSGQLYLKINDTKVTYDGEADAIKTALWQPWHIDLATVGGNLSNVTKLTIGIEGAGATGVVYIDDIRLYPKTVEFITPVEPAGANLLVHYPLEGDVTDSSGNGVHGEELSGPTYGAGVDGQAIQLDGIDDYVSAVLDVPENGCTTAFWFKTANPNCGLYAVVQNPLGDGGYDRMIYLVDGNVGVRIYDTEVIVAAVNVADGQWHHLVHMYGDAVGGQRLYLDGLLQAQGTKAQSDFDWQERVHFGWSVDAAEDFFEGMLDDARIYDRTLSLAEIAWLAGKRVPIPVPLEDDDL